MKSSDLTDQTKVSIGLLITLVGAVSGAFGAIVRGEANKSAQDQRISRLEAKSEKDEDFKRSLSNDVAEIKAQLSILLRMMARKEGQ